MNSLLTRIITGMLFALFAAIALIYAVTTPLWGRIFTDPTWYPIQHTAELIQSIIDNTPQEKVYQEIDYLSTVLNRRIEIISADDSAIPEVVKQKIPYDRPIYAVYKDGKKKFFTPVHHKSLLVLIDPSFQQYKPLINLPLSAFITSVLSIIAAIVGFWFAIPITRRLSKIEAAAERISQGDITAKVQDISTDLIGNVEKCFNHMAERIQSLITNRQKLLSSIIQKFQIPIAQIDGYLKELNSSSEIKNRSEKIDRAIDDIELLVSDLLTQEKVRLSGNTDLMEESRRERRSEDAGTMLYEKHTFSGSHRTIAAERTKLKPGDVKFILRISIFIITALLLNQLFMLAAPRIGNKRTNINPTWYPAHTMATLIQRAVDITPEEDLSARLDFLQKGLNRRLDLISAEEAGNLFTKTAQQEFAGKITYGVFNGRNVFKAPVHSGATILMIDNPAALYDRNPSLIFHALIFVMEFMLTGLFGIFLSLPIIRNLKKLIEGIERLQMDELSARVDIPVNKPIGTLAAHFNEMAERIQSLLDNQRQLMRAVVHEIRTPVSRIRFHLEMLMDSEDEQEINRRAGDIGEEIKELELLLKELSTFTALDAMKDVLTLEAVSLYDTLIEAAAYHQKTNPSIQIVLLNTRGDNLKIYAHPIYFKRAVQNILSNAVRHAQKKLSLHYYSAREGVFIEICDDGPGIPIHSREMVLEPFTRLDDSRNRKSGGFGLGLAIVNRILQLHGGAVSISENFPQGAKVTTWWPN